MSETGDKINIAPTREPYPRKLNEREESNRHKVHQQIGELIKQGDIDQAKKMRDQLQTAADLKIISQETADFTSKDVALTENDINLKDKTAA